MTASRDGEAGPEVGRTIPERQDRTNTPLEEPAASRATLFRRLRAVERALAGADVGFEEFGFDVAVARTEGTGEDDPDVPDLDAVEERIAALERAVRAIGRHLAARDRARRTEGELGSVERAVEALPDADATGDGDAGGSFGRAETVEGGSGAREGAAVTAAESPTEWLDRVAAGGVTPPPVE